MYLEEAASYLWNEKEKKKGGGGRANGSTASGSRAMHGIFDCSTIKTIPGLTLQHKYSLPWKTLIALRKKYITVTFP